MKMMHGWPEGPQRQNKEEREESVNSVLPPKLVACCSVFAWCSHPQRRGSVKSALA